MVIEDFFFIDLIWDIIEFVWFIIGGDLRDSFIGSMEVKIIFMDKGDGFVVWGYGCVLDIISLVFYDGFCFVIFYIENLVVGIVWILVFFCVVGSN